MNIRSKESLIKASLRESPRVKLLGKSAKMAFNQRFLKRVLLLFCWLYGSLGSVCGELDVTANLDQYGKAITLALRDERIRVLKELRVSPTKSSNPTFSELLELINERLAAKKLGYRIVVHVSEKTKLWWEAARAMTLSESNEMLSADAAARHEYLRTASCWDIAMLVGLNCGMPDAMFVDSAVIFSPEKGSLPYTLKEHIPPRGVVK